MKLAYVLTLFVVILVPPYSYGEGSKFCTEENYKKIMVLYQNRNSETAKTVFQILSCKERISDQSIRGQFVALVGGYMQKNPALIDHLLISARTAKNADAAKIYLDGLWFCSTRECKGKLRERPFELPVEDVDKLIAEPPPDPLSIPIKSPATLDFLWGYFFGTGDTRIVERIYGLISDNWEALNSNKSIGLDKRIVLSAAHWSLLSLASQQELVRSVLEKKKTPVAEELLKKVNKK